MARHLVCGIAAAALAAAAEASVLFNAPGHVALEGAAVTASGGEPGAAWALQDWRGRETEFCGVFDEGGNATLPPLPAGYYRLGDATLAVVRPCGEGTILPSFYGVDSAQSWCAGPGAFDCPWNGGDTFRTVSDLARLAGVPHVRDRMTWVQVNPERGVFKYGKYLYNADLLRERGIGVSGVFHDCPPWIGRIKSLPADLAAVYDFCARVAADFGDRMDAWEFWNEEELGHTPEPVWDYAAVLKAAYLGFKAGRQDATVLVGALSDGSVRPGRHYGPVLLDNDAGKFFDVFNYHTYSPIADYPRQIGTMRDLLDPRGFGERAIWVTEFGTYLEGPATGESPKAGVKAHSPEQELVQAEFCTKAQIAFQMQGVARSYLFLFGTRSEGGGKKDFGTMRLDGTVKPIFSAIATMTRELGSARLAGEVKVGDGLRAYLFEQPDGSQTVAFWSISPMDTAMGGVVAAEPDFARTLRLRCGGDASAAFRLTDLCGTRSTVAATNGVMELTATRFPAYVSGLRGLVADIPARPAGKALPYEPAADEDLTVVIRAEPDWNDFKLTDSKTRVSLDGESGRVRVIVWNLGDVAKTGRVEASGCPLEGLPESIALGPRGTPPAVFDCVLKPDATTGALPTLVLSGAFDGKRSSRLSMPIAIPKRLFGDSAAVPLDWRDPKNWMCYDSAQSHSVRWDDAEQALRFDMEWTNPKIDRWFYPVYRLKTPHETLAGALAFQFEARSAQDKPENDYRWCCVKLRDGNGAEAGDFTYAPPTETWERRHVVFGNGADPRRVAAILVGGNPNGLKCTFWLRNVEILKPSNR